jgi:hypothetical protein
VTLLGRRALSESPERLVLETVCSLIIAGGFILGVIAFFAPKVENKGRVIAGICINGLMIAFVILSIFTRQKVAARESHTPKPPRKSWSFISGR